MAVEEEQRNIRNQLGENITPSPPPPGNPNDGDDGGGGESEQNLLDLTNQPTGLILGEYAGTPLYSI